MTWNLWLQIKNINCCASAGPASSGLALCAGISRQVEAADEKPDNNVRYSKGLDKRKKHQFFAGKIGEITRGMTRVTS
jgi:hypothetical protein